jgi:hypothetical protein
MDWSAFVGDLEETESFDTESIAARIAENVPSSVVPCGLQSEPGVALPEGMTAFGSPICDKVVGTVWFIRRNNCKL